MPLPDIDTNVGHSFGLEVDGVFSSRLSGASGLKMERDVVERREEVPGGTVIVRKLAGPWKSPCRPPRWMRMTASRSMRMSDRRFRASDRWIVVTVAAWSSA